MQNDIATVLIDMPGAEGTGCPSDEDFFFYRTHYPACYTSGKLVVELNWLAIVPTVLIIVAMIVVIVRMCSKPKNKTAK